MQIRHAIPSFPRKAVLYLLKLRKLGSVAKLRLPNMFHFTGTVIISMQKSWPSLLKWYSSWPVMCMWDTRGRYSCTEGKSRAKQASTRIAHRPLSLQPGFLLNVPAGKILLGNQNASREGTLPLFIWSSSTHTKGDIQQVNFHRLVHKFSYTFS